jgi:hypothetical protein
VNEQTEHAKAEQACVEFVMKAQGLGRDEATRFFNQGLARGLFDGHAVDLEFRRLVVAYKNALTDYRHSGAAGRHVRDVTEIGRRAVRERVGKA